MRLFADGLCRCAVLTQVLRVPVGFSNSGRRVSWKPVWILTLVSVWIVTLVSSLLLCVMYTWCALFLFCFSLFGSLTCLEGKSRQDLVYSKLKPEEKAAVDEVLGIARGGDLRAAMLKFAEYRDECSLSRSLALECLSRFLGSYDEFRAGVLLFYQFRAGPGGCGPPPWVGCR